MEYVKEIEGMTFRPGRCFRAVLPVPDRPEADMDDYKPATLPAM